MITVHPLSGEATAKVGSETLTLVFDMAALIVAEQTDGRSFPELAADLLIAAQTKRLAKVGTMRALLFGATRAHHPELTADQCGALYLSHVDEIGTAVATVLIAALPKADREDAPGEA